MGGWQCTRAPRSGIATRSRRSARSQRRTTRSAAWQALSATSHTPSSKPESRDSSAQRLRLRVHHW
eukprot:3621597-Rhodomonas_salina.1